VAGNLILDADGGEFQFHDGGTNILEIANSSSDVIIRPAVQDKDLIFNGNDGGGAITALTLDMSENGHATFRAGATFNESSLDSDFRVESNGQTHAFFVDGGTNAMGIGTAPPSDSHTGWNQVFIGQKGSLISENATGTHGIDGMHITDNLYMDADTGSFANIETNESSAYRQEAGIHRFFSQGSGSAGAAVTLAEQARITTDGIALGTNKYFGDASDTDNYLQFNQAKTFRIVTGKHL